jgi:hypothetical protein
MFKLSPSIPLVWRTPHSLQVGVDEPLAVFDPITPAQERVIAALRSGMSREMLLAVAQTHGVGDTELEEILARVDRALEGGGMQGVPRRHIAVDGTGEAADRIADLLARSGHRVVRAPGVTAPRVDAAIVVARHVVEPHRVGAWLRRDTPHICAVFGDASATLGPVHAGEQAGPCAQCVEMHRRDGDPAWPAIASQLLGKPSAVESPLLVAEVATLATRWVSARHTSVIRAGVRVRIVAQSGARTEQLFSVHPECACQSLPENASVPGTVTDLRNALPTTA